MAFTIPVSMTYLIPEMVMEVSAIFVDRITFLEPWNAEKEGESRGRIFTFGFKTCVYPTDDESEFVVTFGAG